MASAILPFVLYSSTVKSGILYAFIHIASPIPSFHEVIDDDLSHPYSFLSVEEVIYDLLSSSIDLFVVPSHLYKKKENLAFPATSCERLRALSLAREIHKFSQKKSKKTNAYNNIPENSNFLGRRKGERKKIRQDS